MSKIILIAIIILASVSGLWVWENKPWIKEVEERSGFDLIDKKQEELVALGSKVKTIQGTGTIIPSTVPSEFIYSGAAVQTIQQMGGRGVMMVLTTSQSRTSVADSLSKKLVEAGWKLTSGSFSQIADLEKGGQKAQIEIAIEGNTTVISLGLTFNLL